MFNLKLVDIIFQVKHSIFNFEKSIEIAFLLN